MLGAGCAPAQPEEGPIFVGLQPGVEHKPTGWKGMLHHPFESPFVDDEPGIAAARYSSWLQASDPTRP